MPVAVSNMVLHVKTNCPKIQYQSGSNEKERPQMSNLDRLTSTGEMNHTLIAGSANAVHEVKKMVSRNGCYERKLNIKLVSFSQNKKTETGISAVVGKTVRLSRIHRQSTIHKIFQQGGPINLLNLIVQM